MKPSDNRTPPGLPYPWRLSLLPLLVSLAACADGASDKAASTESRAESRVAAEAPAAASTPAAAATLAAAPDKLTPERSDAATVAPAIPAAVPSVAATPAQPAAPKAIASKTLPLPTGSHRYRFSWDGQLEGSAVRTLSCQQETCTLRTEASVPGVATMHESSRFTWQDGRVHFDQYERKLQLLFLPQVVRISRLADGQIRTERKGKIRTYAGSPALIDTLGLEAQLRADLVSTGSAGKRYTVADMKGPLDVTLEELPREKLTLAGKTVEARVFRRRNEDGTRITTLWLDPAQAYLTVQALHQDDGNTYRLSWTGAGD